MGNPLSDMFGRPMGGGMNMLQIISAIKSGNPQDVAMRLAKQNPQFARFLDANKGKSVNQLASEYGIDLNAIQNLLK